jgi:MFS family permease
MELKEAANVSSIVLGAVGIIGLLAGGWAADRVAKIRSDGKLLLSSITMLIAVPCIYFALNKQPGETLGFMLLMGAGTMFMFVYYSCVYSTIQDVIEPALRGTAMALYFFAMYLLGGCLGPLVTGMLSDHFATKAMTAAGASEMTEQFKAVGLHNAMYAIPIICAVLACVLFAASRTVAVDVEKLRTWIREQ